MLKKAGILARSLLLLARLELRTVAGTTYSDGHDPHLLLQVISEVKDEAACIHNNAEKYVSSLEGQRFIDSAQCLHVHQQAGYGGSAGGFRSYNTKRVRQRKARSPKYDGASRTTT